MPAQGSAKGVVPSHTMLLQHHVMSCSGASLTELCFSRNLPPAGYCSHFGGPEGAAKQHIASGQAAERALDIRAAAAAYEQVRPLSDAACPSARRAWAG